ncbi:hypothetical protein [Desulfonatronum lacustre]|uniref:hypothetical protein n=1 Tax=Desulfonatronum lacustre TaxID=66849 RepID=UPI000491679A|nr:hypothetical protein [Desulfonatronum lacustre]
MDIRADSGLSRTIGRFAAGMALVLFLVWMWLRPGGELSAFAGVVLSVVAAGCFSYRHEVHIDQRADVVEEYRRILFRERHRGFLFSDFRAVGVANVLGGDLRPVYLAHVVELRGRSRLVLPGVHFGLERARGEAADLARQLDLPLESRVRTILWS